MPRRKKVTKKRLKELAEDTNAALNTFYCEEISRNIRCAMDPEAFRLQSRLINAGATLEQATELKGKLEAHITRSVQQFVNGWGVNFANLTWDILSDNPQIRSLAEDDQYVRFTEEELVILRTAQQIVKKVGDNYALSLKDTSQYRATDYRIEEITTEWERPGYNFVRAIEQHPRYQAARIEFENHIENSLKPAKEILSTRVRRHGGKMTFGYVDAMVEALRDLTEEEAKERFDAVVQQVDDSLQNFINLMVNPPELMAITVNLKSTRLQAAEQEEEHEDYLEIV